LNRNVKNPVTGKFRAIAGNSSAEARPYRVEKSCVQDEQANDQRALYRRFALNRKKSLQTDEGRAFLAKTMHRLAPINEFSTVSMVRVFGALDSMEVKDQVPLVGVLAGLLEDLDPEKTPSVYNTVRRVLAASPRAVKNYEQTAKTIPGLRT
jgi:aminopeptidase N